MVLAVCDVGEEVVFAISYYMLSDTEVVFAISYSSYMYMQSLLLWSYRHSHAQYRGRVAHTVHHTVVFYTVHLQLPA